MSQYKFKRGVSSGNLGTSTYNYTYDDNGNITQIKNASGGVIAKYRYDDLDQLEFEANSALGKTYKWTYDNAGNITGKYTYAYTENFDNPGTPQSSVIYTYSNSNWGDRLTSANGWTYTYDAIGNPLTKTNTAGTEGYRYVWQGRRLLEIYKCWYDSGVLTYEDLYAAYTYNADGIRTGITGGYGSTHDYLLDGTRIISDTIGTNSTFIYIYDEMGSPIGLKYRTTSYAEGVFDYFFYEKNLQGDIVAIYNESGTRIAAYTYDAWGNFTKAQTSGITYSAADTFVYNNNPFTYRGYYYDGDTGLYYLQTRYYDASIGRFISADGYVSTGQGLTGYNMYAYCNNNPLMFVDESGEFPWLIAIAVAIVVVASTTLSGCRVNSDGEVSVAPPAYTNIDTSKSYDDYQSAVEAANAIVYEEAISSIGTYDWRGNYAEYGVEYNVDIYINKHSLDFYLTPSYTDNDIGSVNHRNLKRRIEDDYVFMGYVHYHPYYGSTSLIFSNGDMNVARHYDVAAHIINYEGETNSLYTYLPSWKKKFIN